MSSKGKIKIKDQLTDDVAAAGADRKPDREFSGPVGGACSEILARFMHAARRTKKAMALSTNRKARSGSLMRSPIKPGRISRALNAASSRYCLASWLEIAFKLLVACAAVTPGFRDPITWTLVAPRCSRKFQPSICCSSMSGMKKSGRRNFSLP